MARYVKFENSTAAECRWSEYISPILGDWEIIWDDSRADWQGSVKLLAHKEGKFAYVNYDYGSCSGCDGWEEMSEETRVQDFKNLIEFFSDVHELKKFADQVNYGKDFEDAVDDFIFHMMLEKELVN